ncbi:hypothetical protein ACPW96_01180 [Micromonospora sp. DT81.3]|uniref:hypothetical protein n=1 Tax=Micromonospora sp. DT81.3 TaxID=3416523 RepID=UPI003CF2BA4C
MPGSSRGLTSSGTGDAAARFGPVPDGAAQGSGAWVAWTGGEEGAAAERRTSVVEASSGTVGRAQELGGSSGASPKSGPASGTPDAAGRTCPFGGAGRSSAGEDAGGAEGTVRSASGSRNGGDVIPASTLTSSSRCASAGGGSTGIDSSTVRDGGRAVVASPLALATMRSK